MDMLSFYLSAIRHKASWGHFLASNDGKKPRAPWRKDNGVANRHNLHVSMKKKNPVCYILNILWAYNSLYNVPCQATFLDVILSKRVLHGISP